MKPIFLIFSFILISYSSFGWAQSQSLTPQEVQQLQDPKIQTQIWTQLTSESSGMKKYIQSVLRVPNRSWAKGEFFRWIVSDPDLIHHYYDVKDGFLRTENEEARWRAIIIFREGLKKYLSAEGALELNQELFSSFSMSPAALSQEARQLWNEARRARHTRRKAVQWDSWVSPERVAAVSGDSIEAPIVLREYLRNRGMDPIFFEGPRYIKNRFRIRHWPTLAFFQNWKENDGEWRANRDGWSLQWNVPSETLILELSGQFESSEHLDQFLDRVQQSLSRVNEFVSLPIHIPRVKAYPVESFPAKIDLRPIELPATSSGISAIAELLKEFYPDRPTVYSGFCSRLLDVSSR